MSDSCKLILSDCLEELKKIPNKSVDLVLTDPPYNITACEWDNEFNLSIFWKECKRVLKISGNIVMTASQPFTSKLILSNISWFSHSLIWEKEQGVNFLLANKQPLKIHEDICVFRVPNNFGVDNFVELRNYFKSILLKIGIKKSEVVKEQGQGLDHCFRINSEQWSLPTKYNYNLLSKRYGIKLVEYDLIKSKYELEFFRTYNPQKVIGKPYISGKGSSGDVTGNVKKIQTVNDGERFPTSIIKFNRDTGLHPTQKPVKLMKYLIKTYSNEGDVVIDPFMGSGSTGVAALKLNRKFIGIEIEYKYFEIAKKRIGDWESQTRLNSFQELVNDFWKFLRLFKRW